MVIGLTGGIGCGKSEALKCFGALGWICIDADAICRCLYESKDSKIVSAIKDKWGKEAFFEDGTVNKKFIANTVFRNKNELAWLNSVIHPAVFEEAFSIIKKNEGKSIIFDVPLLFEGKYEKKFDYVICVWCDRKTQIERLEKRGLETDDITDRLDNQLPQDKKLEMADFGIINSGNIDSLMKQCIFLNNKLRTQENGKKKN